MKKDVQRKISETEAQNMIRKLKLQQSELELLRSELKTAESDLKQSKIKLQEKENDLTLLAKTSVILLDFNTIEDIYHWLGDRLYQLSGADYMLLSEYSEATKTTSPKSVFGLNTFIGKINSLLGKEISQVQIPVEDVAEQMDLELRKKIYLVKGGLYELTVQKIPKVICRSVEKILGVNQLFSVGFIWKNNYFGGVTLAFRKGNQFNKSALIEAIANQASLALSRKQSEKSLIESEAKYRSIFDNIQDVYYETTLDGTILELSPSIKILSNGQYLREELIGKPISNFYYEKDARPKLIQKLKQDLHLSNYEIKLINKDNSLIYCTINAKLQLDSNNNPIKIIGTLHNITEHKLTEEIIRSSEEKFNKAFQIAPVVITIQDNKGVFLDVNKAFLELTGYSIDEIIGHSDDELNLWADENERRYANMYYRKNGNFSGFEFRFRKKTGQTGYGIISSEAIKLNGKPAELTIVIDITERKLTEQSLRESEQRYQTLTEISPVGIFRTDTKGYTTYVNPHWSKISGMPTDKALGNGWLSAVHPDDRDKLAERWESATRQRTTSSAEYRFIRPDGSIAWVIGQTAEEKNSNGEIVGYVGTITDITEQKSAEEHLKLFRTFFDESPIGIELYDKEGFQTDANQASLSMFGLTDKTEILGFNIFNGTSLSEENKEKLQRGETVTYQAEFDFDLVKKLHQYKSNRTGKAFFDYIITPLWNLKQKSIQGFLLQVSDVTVRKNAEDELLKLSRAVEQSPVSIIITNTKGKIEYVNPRVIELTGYQLAEVIGHNPNMFSSGEKAKEEYKDLWNKICSGNEWRGEFHNKKKNGELFWEQASLSPILNDKGEITHFLAVKEDITDRKRDRQIQSLLYNISNAVITTDNLEQLIHKIQSELGTIIDTTNFYLALYDAATDTISLPFFSDENDEFTAMPAENTITNYVIKTKKSLLADLNRIHELENSGEIGRYGSDSLVWMGVPLKVAGEVMGVLAVQSYTNENAFKESDMKMLEFISDQISIAILRKKTEENLKTALAKAEESDRLKSAFLANISHEIRTPMNGILGFSTLLKEPDLTGDQQQKYISIIEKSGARMLSTLQDLMDISKIESGQMDVTISKVNLIERITDLYNFFKPQSDAKRLDFSINISLSPEEAIVNSDKKKIDGILSNLIINAIKYTHEGSIEVGCKTIDTDDHRYLQFYIKDTGIGIPENRHQAIFDRFVQADIEDRAVYEGSGLGLSITKAYVEMLGGKIWIESKEGLGTTFFFTLPHDTNQQTQNQASEKIVKEEVISKSRKLSILIAEDDETSSLLMTIAMEEFADKFFMTRTGLEVIKTIKEHPEVELIMMDIRMPEMNGFQATRLIREFNQNVIIIAQTSYALAGDREKALAAGCNDYITKPIDKSQLHRLIKKYFN